MLSQMQSSLRGALSHVPLMNGAVVGPDADMPDLPALTALLHQGKKVLQEMTPALQVLLGPDYCKEGEQDIAAGRASGGTAVGVGEGSAAAGRVGGGSSAAGDSSRSRSGHSQEGVPGPSMRRSICTTTSYAGQLMETVNQECELLLLLNEQLRSFEQLQLYANSMEVQLIHIEELKVVVQH